MKKIEFDASEEGKHVCTSKKVGDWIIYRCPLCPDYQRKYNLKTGEMKTKCNKDNYNLHIGSYAKPGLNTGLYHPN
jgi:hypothetical protein